MRIVQAVGVVFGLAFLWWAAIIMNHGRSSFVSDYRERAEFKSRLSGLHAGMSAAEVFSRLGATSDNVHSLGYLGGTSVGLMISWATKRGMDNEVLPPWVEARFMFPAQLDAIRASACGERAVEFKACLKNSPPELTWHGAKLAYWEVVQ